MSRFERPTSLGLGVLFLAAFAWSFSVSLETITAAPGSSTAIATIAGGVAMLVGGLAFAVAGYTDRLTLGSYTLEWYQLQSVGYAAIGLYILISGLVQLPSVLGVFLLIGGVGIVVFSSYRLRAGPATDDAAQAG